MSLALTKSLNLTLTWSLTIPTWLHFQGLLKHSGPGSLRVVCPGQAQVERLINVGVLEVDRGGGVIQSVLHDILRSGVNILMENKHEQLLF